MSELVMRLRRNTDPAVLIASGCVVVLLIGGSLYSPNFLSPDYLLQQLRVASFLGIIATGSMIIILLGHIDLSIPWVVTLGAMMATAAAGWWGDTGVALAIPFGVACGALVGAVSGFGVAFLRVPSMIFTLGVNTVLLGLMVMLTGGHAPQSAATDLMLFLGRDRSFGVLPHSVVVWAAVSLVLVFILTRTPLGRYMYAIGNQEGAAYLSGVRTRLVIVATFVMCSMCAAIAGLALAGYSARAYQAMGDQYLLPSIAAVVIGGTHILGGRGRYAGTVVGAVLIVLLQSVVSIMQMEGGYRQVIYGMVVIGMLLIYGRGRKAES
jgi:ribose transport system permease protein